MDTPKKKVLYKIVLLGEEMVGKTNIIKVFVKGGDAFSDRYQPTIGADFLTKTDECSNVLCTLQVWDSAGQERFQSLGVAFTRGVKGILLVYDVTKKSSFIKLDKHLGRVSDTDQKEACLIVIGNKLDLSSNREVTTDEGKAYAEKIGATFFETSAKVETTIENVFKGLIREIIVKEGVVKWWQK